MLKEKVTIERKPSVLFTCDFGGGSTKDYAMAWLKLWNNAREYPNTIYKVANNSGNTVYVWCNPRSADATEEFLTDIYVNYGSATDDTITRIGIVVSRDYVTIGQLIYDADSTYSFDDDRWNADLDNMITDWVMTVE